MHGFKSAILAEWKFFFKVDTLKKYASLEIGTTQVWRMYLKVLA